MVVSDSSTSISGGTYTGRLVNNRRDGRGTCKWPTGYTYDGEWRDGQKHGRGVFRWSDGVAFDGECNNGYIDGWGVCLWPDGASYEGLWRNGCRKRGTWRSSNGAEVRDGEWVHNLVTKECEMEGWGVLRRKVPRGAGSGGGEIMVTVYEGEWEANKWHGWGTWRSPMTGDIYCGQFDQQVRCGKGSMLFGGEGDKGGMYVGEWRDDMFHGRGVRIWGDGTRYEGDWVCGKEHGKGTKTWACDGTSFVGVWEMGVMKSGMQRWPNGDEFSGTFTSVSDGGGSSTRPKDLERRGKNTSVGMFPKSGVFKECGVVNGIDWSGDRQLGFLENQVRVLESENHHLKQEVSQLLENQEAFQLKAASAGIDHILQHIQQGCWVKSLVPTSSLIPQESTTIQQGSGNECVMKEVSITLERPNIMFHESFCSKCPFEKIVKMEIEKRFGVDENYQIISVSKESPSHKDPHNEAAVLLSGSSLTLSQLPLDFSEEAQPQVRVGMTPMLVIQEKDLITSTVLGVGSYGTVFKGTHVPTSREVAVKSLHDDIVSDYHIERFRLEAEIMSGLRHPNIVKYLGMCTTASGKLLLVSELLCCSLKQLLMIKQLKFQEVAAITFGISKGMDSLHRQNFMHRDLSSKNVLLDAAGNPKICDFGVSREMNSQYLHSRAAQWKRSQSKGPGTPLYMSPQMFTAHYTSKGDVWSFGILTTELINGEVIDTGFQASPLSAQVTFLEKQKRLLSPQDIQEVDRLCRESTESTVVCCLSRRDACLNAVNTLVHLAESPLFSQEPPRGGPDAASVSVAADLLFLVVQSCLSVCENNRVPFPMITQMLHSCCTCAAIALSEPPSASSGLDPSVSVTEDQVHSSMTQWLASLSVTVSRT
ncbi:phosphatidylinositol-4-phosphate 5-kinase [Pelomyxa schiedti]|nr:phosphatidylinositol-4-phosphate 5-kinase [Pelomyxa schiedti]